MKQVNTISPAEAGKIIKMRAQSVRLGLQQGRFSFGTAIQKPNGRWTYNIIESKVYEYAGIRKENSNEDY